MQHWLTTATPFKSQKILFKARALGSNLKYISASNSRPALASYMILLHFSPVLPPLMGSPPPPELHKVLRYTFFQYNNQKYVSRNKPRETRFDNGTQVKPCRSVLRTGWVTNREYCLKGPYVVLSFLLLLFCVLCGVIVNSVLKSRCSIISAPGFRKRQKQRTNLVRHSSPENYYSSGRNTELKLCRL